MQRFNVVIPTDDGGVAVHPMKQWLRQHPDHIPAGMHPTTSTSHSLRNGLKKQGWVVQDTPSEVRLLMPGTSLQQANVANVLGSAEEEEVADPADEETSFALEYQLRDFIAHNLPTISVGGRKLKLYVDPTGRDGIEFPTDVGPIDILAVDERGNFVVFELKRARSPDRAIGQLSRYMGWTKSTIGADREVSGAIVAKEITDNLRYAVTVIPNVSLFEYQVSFQLTPAPAIVQGRRVGT